MHSSSTTFAQRKDNTILALIHNKKRKKIFDFMHRKTESNATTKAAQKIVFDKSKATKTKKEAVGLGQKDAACQTDNSDNLSPRLFLSAGSAPPLLPERRCSPPQSAASA